MKHVKIVDEDILSLLTKHPDLIKEVLPKADVREGGFCAFKMAIQRGNWKSAVAFLPYFDESRRDDLAAWRFLIDEAAHQGIAEIYQSAKTELDSRLECQALLAAIPSKDSKPAGVKKGL